MDTRIDFTGKLVGMAPNGCLRTIDECIRLTVDQTA
jgi:hypothetical protein